MSVQTKNTHWFQRKNGKQDSNDMDKIARIRAEIERRREDILSKVHHYPIHRIELLDDLLSFLDTLSEEPDKTFDDYLKATPAERRKMNMTEILGEERLTKTRKQTSLEEAAENYEQTRNDLDAISDNEIVRRAFTAGTEWQKNQMLKDAFVADYVAVDDGRIELEGDPLPCLNPIILLPYPQFQPGDRVKVIVIKEED